MKVIINADDFGKSQHINNSIYKALEGQWITSATILAGSANVEEAVEMCSDFNNASFGAHLALTGPFNINHKNDSIIENSEFRITNVKNLKRLKLSAVNDITDEYSRQIEKLLRLGVDISHVDTHHHLHLYLPALLGLIKAAKRYNINKVRNLNLAVNHGLIKRIYRYANSVLARISGLQSPDCYCDLSTFPKLTTEFKKSRTIEIMCHPGYQQHYNDEQYFNSEFYENHLNTGLINYHNL